MKPELLSPVQDFVSLSAAIDAGADAVYFGIKGTNMRSSAKNFSLRELPSVVKQCHDNGVKAYLALNIVFYDNELVKLKKILKRAKDIGIDAVICWDFAVISEANRLKLPIHVSTQASISNTEAMIALKKQFNYIERVVLARELSLKQVKDITKGAKKIGVGIEVFIHGSMCVSISGRCLMSHEIYGKSANRGECYQPCRRKYLIKEIDDGNEMELGKDFVLSPKDLCTLPILKRIVKAGVCSLKIEGRNKSPEYVKTVTSVYRKALDNPKADTDKLYGQLKMVYNRGFSTGFYLGKPMNEWTENPGNNATVVKKHAGKVINFYRKPMVAEILLETEKLKLGDTIMIQGNKTGVISQEIESMQRHKEEIRQAEKGQLVGIKVNRIVRKNDQVYCIARC